jgi:hypothetical protein
MRLPAMSGIRRLASVVRIASIMMGRAIAPRTTAADATLRRPAAAFDSKADLLKQFEAQRAGTLAALARTDDADFDRQTGVAYAPTVAAMFELQGSHWLMHAGQWAVVRRSLGRPPLF